MPGRGHSSAPRIALQIGHARSHPPPVHRGLRGARRSLRRGPRRRCPASQKAQPSHNGMAGRSGRVQAGSAVAVPSASHGCRAGSVGEPARRRAGSPDRWRGKATENSLGGPARFRLPGIPPQRQPVALREHSRSPPQEAPGPRHGRVPGSEGPLRGRNRQRRLAHLRGDVLGRARAPGSAEGRRRIARRHRADRRSVRRRDRQPAGMDLVLWQAIRWRACRRWCPNASAWRSTGAC